MFTRSLKRELAAAVRLLCWSRIRVLKEWDRQRENVKMWWLLTPDGLPATVAWLFPQQITVWYEASCPQKTCDSYLVKMVTLCPSLFQSANSVHVCVSLFNCEPQQCLAYLPHLLWWAEAMKPLSVTPPPPLTARSLLNLTGLFQKCVQQDVSGRIEEPPSQLKPPEKQRQTTNMWLSVSVGLSPAKLSSRCLWTLN